MHAKEDKCMQWIISPIMGERFKDNMQIIVVMPQGLTKLPTPYTGDNLKKEDLWLIDDQHNVGATKKIQLIENLDDPYM